MLTRCKNANATVYHVKARFTKWVFKSRHRRRMQCLFRPGWKLADYSIQLSWTGMTDRSLSKTVFNHGILYTSLLADWGIVISEDTAADGCGASVHPVCTLYVPYSRFHILQLHMAVVFSLWLYGLSGKRTPVDDIAANSLPVFHRRLKTHLCIVMFADK